MGLTFTEKIIEIENKASFDWFQLYSILTDKIKGYIVALNLVKTTKQSLFFKVTIIEGFVSPINKPFFPKDFSCNYNKKIKTKEKDISCLIIPTGIGARFGGYAGDANPIAKALSTKTNHLLTHPNTVNGAVLSDVPQNLIYLEGFLLDQFLIGKINIKPNKNNKIGIIFDSGIAKKRLEYELNVLNATKSFYGCNIQAWTLTRKNIKIQTEINSMGFSTGTIKNMEYILQEADKLKKLGCTALAICCRVNDSNINKEYIKGAGIDPIGGIESLISRTVSAYTGLVSAHAPVLTPENEQFKFSTISPVAASEYIAKTFLPSVISGLRYAPEILYKDLNRQNVNEKTFENISELIMPFSGCGNVGTFFLKDHLDRIVLVKENSTSLKVNPSHLNVNFKIIESYLDLIDKKLMEDAGLNPDCLKRPIAKVSRLI